MNQKTEYQFVESLFDCVKQNIDQNTILLLDLIHEEHKEQVLLQHLLEEETILHVAVKARATADIVSRLVDLCPVLLLQAREGSETYRGQTALHIAITQGDIEVTQFLLTKAEILGQVRKTNLLHQRATGSKFVNTVMMGELPLSVAALKLNITVIDVLLKHGADLSEQNSTGDNICHSLIRYAHLYPEKESEIMKVFDHISKLSVLGMVCKADVKVIESMTRGDLERRYVHIWLMEDVDGLNPLKLSAKLGQQLIFKYIMELKGVYCYTNSEDGLFDVKLYDVTDIDFVSELKLSHIIPVAFDPLKSSMKSAALEKTSKSPCVPTLEMIFNSDASVVFKFIQFSPLRYVINRKWEYYKWFYLLWGVLHVLFIVGYSVYAVERSKLPRPIFNGPVSQKYLNQIHNSGYIIFYLVLSLVVASVYLIQEIVRITRRRMPWTWSHIMNCYHNGPFRLVLILFSICVIADFIWRMTDPNYDNYLLVCAMILGWYFLVFFLRALRQFSFFTVMIQKVLVGDMFRFSIIIGMELVAFTTAVFIAFQGTITSDNSNTLEHYGQLMVLMFKMMFGLTSLDVLFEARQPWFAVCLYTAFVLLTYVLMVNSLIAMMSNTCSMVSQNREVQWRVQQLSIILFFESILPSYCLRLVGHPRQSEWYDATTGQYVKKERHFMEVRSLMEVTRSKSRLRMNQETMIETIFQTIRDIQLPSFGIFENESADKTKHTADTTETTREERQTKPKLKNNTIKTEASEIKDKESTANNHVEKKKRKKKKRVHVDSVFATHDLTSHTKEDLTLPRRTDVPLTSPRMTEVEYLSSDIISPELAVERCVTRAAKTPTVSRNLENEQHRGEIFFGNV